MAPAIDFRQNRYVRKLNDWFSRLSLRARIAGTMIALVASAGLVLSAWAYLADEQLKRNITLDLLSEELTHFEQRMRVDRGAEPLRSARLSIYRSSDLAELPRHIAMLKPGEMHRVRSGGRLLDVLVRDGDFGRLYITYDVTTYATQDAIALLVLAIGVIAIVIVAALAAAAISRRLVEPVTALAARLTEIDPGERHVRIGAQFAGNELEPIARSVDMFMERLDGFVEREQSFTATASHELRTPLAVMRGAVELLENSSAADRPGAGKALARIQRAVREMSEFTDALLALSREQQAAAATDTTCDVNAVLARVVEDQRSVSPAKRIVLEIETGTNLKVAAPESMVAMTIGNLVRNAVQHGTGGDVLCRSQGRELVVTNAGTLPTDNPASLRRFTTHPGGHGMGLYLVRRICERYGWEITLENGPQGVSATVGFV
jgi:signal transduction histidine kinase